MVYRSLVLHYFGEALDDAHVKVWDRIRDVDRHFQGSFTYAKLRDSEVLPAVETDLPPEPDDGEIDNEDAQALGCQPRSCTGSATAEKEPTDHRSVKVD